MGQRGRAAIACVTGIAITACGSAGNSAATHTAKGTTTAVQAARPGTAKSYRVYQLPPGHITLAEARTPRGPVAIALHRIRYFGHVSLCVNESTANGGGGQTCANYPLGPKSNQNIGHAPVWWAADLLEVCTKPHFQVVGGVVLRHGVTAWLRTPAGVSRMPTAAIPRAFGVAGGLVYATITTAPDTVTLRDAHGRAVYMAPVEPVTDFPTMGCLRRGVGAAVSVVSAGGFVLSGKGEHVVP